MAKYIDHNLYFCYIRFIIYCDISGIDIWKIRIYPHGKYLLMIVFNFDGKKRRYSKNEF